MEMRRLEDERKRMVKTEEQHKVRTELNRFNKLKMQAKAKAVAKALEFDLKIIGDVARMDEEERKMLRQKKEELRNEVQLYREYLRDQKLWEEQAAKEIDQMYQSEIDKVWKQKEEKWAHEQQARDKLMAEVLASRQEQIRQKCMCFVFWAVQWRILMSFPPPPLVIKYSEPELGAASGCPCRTGKDHQSAGERP